MTSLPHEARAQFTFATDNSGNYSGSFIGSDQGSGFAAWTASTNGGGGSYIGGSGLSASSWAIYSGGTGTGNAFSAYRKSDVALSVGDRWATDFGYTGVTSGGTIGINFYSGGTFRFSLQFTGGGSFWQIKDSASGSYFNTTLGWAGGSPGTTLGFSIERGTNNNYSLNLVQGASSYNATNFTGGATFNFDEIQFYTSGQGGGENVGFNNLRITNNGVFVMGGSVTNSNTFTGSGVMSVGSNTVLHLSQTGNTFTGGVTISNGSTLRAASLGTGTINLSGTLATFDSTARTFTNSTVLGTNVTFGDATGTGALTFSNINLGTNSRTITVSAATTIAGALSQGSFTKAGTGTLQLLSAAGTAFTNTTLSAGTLRISNATALGSGTFTVSGANSVLSALTTIGINNAVVANANFQLGEAATGTGDLTLTNTLNLGTNARTLTVSNATTIAGAVSAGDLTKAGAGTLVLSSANTHTNTTLSAGTLRIGNATSLGSGTFTVGGGVFAASGSTALGINNAVLANADFQIGDGTGTGALTLSNTFNLGTNNRTLTVSNATTISGQISQGNLIKTGAGTLTLSGANAATLTNTTVGAGVLAVSGGSALSDTGTVTLSNVAGATLLVSGSETIGSLTGTGGSVSIAASQTLTVNEVGSQTFSGVISNAGGLTKTNTGTLTLGGANTYAGATTVAQGTLAINTNDRLDNSTAVTVNGGTLNFGGFTDTVGSFTISSGAFTNGTLTAGSYALQGGTVAGVLGAGGITVSTGTTTLGSAGRLNSASSVTINSGQLTVAGNESVAALSGSGGTLNLGAGTFTTTFNSASNSYSGTISGSGGLTKAGSGTLTLSGNNTYGGATTIDAGILSYVGTNTSTATTVNSGGTLMGSGSLGNVTVQSNATISPGLSPGTLSVSNLTWAGGGNYNWQIYDANGTAGATNGYDLIRGNSLNITATTGNKFNINLWSLSGIGPDTNGNAINFANTNSYSWTIGTFTNGITNFSSGVFSINTAATNSTGGFANSLTNANGTGSFSLTTNSTNIILTYTAPSGTYNVTVTNGSFAQGAATGVLNGTNLFVGAAALNKLGTGTLVMTNANTYSGVTTIVEGAISILTNAASGANGALGNAITAVLVGTSTNAVATGFDIGAAGVTNSRDLTIVAGNGTADRMVGTTNTTGTAEQAGSVTFNTNTSLYAASGGTMLYSGALSGSGNLTISNSGTSVFSGANTYSGTTTILTNSTLRIANNSALGTTAGNTVINSGGVLALSNNITEDEAITLSGTGISSGGAIRNVSGNNTLSGALTLAANSQINADSGTLLTLSGGINGANFGLTIGGAGNTTISSAITNSTGSLTKTNAGTLTLTGANTYSGGTLVAEGAVVGDTASLQGTITNNSLVIFDQSTNGTYSSVLSGSGALVKTNTGILTLTAANTQSGGTLIAGGTLSIGSGGTTGSLAGAITNNATLLYNRSDNLTQDTVISGSGVLVKTNTGILTLTAANTQSGGTLIAGGTLSIGSGGTTGSLAGAITNNATLLYNRSDNLTQDTVISGTGALNKAGGGTLTLSQANTYTGATTISNGAINVQNNTGLGTPAGGVTVTSGAALELQGNITVGAESLALNGSGISSGGGLRNVSGNNAYGGAITLGSASRINSDSGTLTLGGGITGTQNLTIGGTANTLVSGAITTSTGTLTKDGAGTVTLTSSGNTFTGNVTVSAGTLAVTNGGAIDNSALVTVDSGSTFSVLGGETVGRFTGAGTVSIASGQALTTSFDSASNNFAGSLTGAGGLTKTGSGTLTLSGNNSGYSGDTALNNGALLVGANGVFGSGGTVTINFDAVQVTRELASADASSYTLNNNFNLYNNTFSLGSANTGSLTLGASTNTFFLGSDGTPTTRTITVNGTQIIGAAVTGGANNNLNKAGSGTLILAGDASGMGGAITNAAGRLQIGNGSTTGTLGSKNVTVASSAELAFNRSDNLTYGGVASGAGTLLKLGAGTLTFTGANTYTGATTISNGSLALSGSGALSTSSALNVASSGANFSISGISGTGTEVASLTGVSGSTVSLGGKALTFGGNNANSTFAGEMSGTGGSFIKTGTGTVTLSGSNSMTGTAQLNDGTILIGNNFALGTNSFQIQFDVGGTKTLASDGSTARTLQITNLNVFNDLTLGVASTGTGALTFAGRVYLGDEAGQNRIITTATGTSHTFAGPVTGARGIVKQGDGTLTLAGTNTSTGGLYIDAGVIDLAGGSLSNSLIEIGGGFNGGAQPGNNAALRLSATSGTFTNSITVNSETNASGQRGTRTIEFANASGSPALSGNISLETGATVNVTNAGGTGILGGIISGSGLLTKSGSGTLALTGANTYTGNTIISNGTLQIGAGGTSGSVAGNITNNAALVFNRSDNSTSANLISGTGTVTKTGAGTLTLSGANTFQGTLTIGQGGLSVGANTNLGGGTAMTISNAAKLLTTASFTSARSLTVGDGGAEIDVASSTIFSNTGTVSGSTALTKTGGGTLSLSNASSSYNGTVAVAAGTLQVNGTASSMGVNITNANSVLMGAGSIGAVTVNNGTRIAPGNSVGNLSVSALTLEAGGGYNWEINAATGTEGTDWDLITVGGGTGTVAINSTSGSPFTIYMLGNPTGWNVTNSYSWTIIDAGTLTGFDSSKFTVNFGGFTGTTPTGTFSFSNVSGNLVMAYAAPDNTYNVTVGANTTANQGSAQATNSVAQFTGASALNKLGSGTLVMTNSANDYSGVTTVKEGTIQINVNAPNNAAGSLGNANTAVVIGDTANNVAAGFNIGVAGVTNSRGLSVVAGTGAADRVIGTTITSGVAEQAGTVAVNTNTTFSAAGGGTLLVSGVISQSGNITISNSGTNIFSGANTYSGTTTVLTNATLAIANNNALGTTGSATTVNNGGTLALSNNISTAENITIAGVGVGTSGALRNLSGANTNTGTITLSANATIAADTGTSLQLGNINNGATTTSLTLSNAANSTILLTGNMSNTDTNTTFFKIGTGSLVISNAAANNTAGAQLQVGGGTVTLASGTFSTNTSAARRALDLGLNPDNSASTNNTAFFVNGGVTLSNTIFVAQGTGVRTLGTESTSGIATFGGEIFLSNNLTVTAASNGTAVFSGNITNIGNLTKAGSGTVVLSGANTFTGNVDITAGRLNVSNSSAIGNLAAVTISNGASFALNSLEEIGSLTGEGDVFLDALLIAGGSGATTTYSGVMNGGGGFVKTGTGTMTLSGASTATGQTFIVGGTLLFATNQGGAFANTIQLGETNGAAAATLALGGSGVTLSNLVNVRSGSSGTMTIVATNSTGASTLASGLTLNKAATLSAQSGGALVVSNAVTLGANQLRVTNAANSAVTIAGNISSSSRTTGELLIDGPGTTTLTGSNGGDVKLTLGSGTLVAGSIANLGDPTGTFFGDKLNFNGGRLSATNDITTGALFGVTVSANGGGVLVSSGKTLKFSDYINDTGAGTTAYTFGVGGGGTLALRDSGQNQFNNQMTFSVTNNSTLQTANLQALGASGTTNRISLDAGTFAYTGTSASMSQRFAIGSGGGTINVSSNGQSLTVSNSVSGAGALTKSGLGTLVLSASNSHSGGINVSAGALSVSAASQLGTSNNALTLDGGTLLSTTSFDLGPARVVTIGTNGGTFQTASGTLLNFDGTITNTSTSSTLTKLGAGTLSLGSGSGKFTGNTTVGQGVLLLTTNTALSQSFVTVSNGAVLTNNFTGSTIDIGDLQGGGTVNAGSNSVTVGSEGNNTTFSGAVNISGSNNFTSVGSGTLTLSGKVSDTQTGSTIVGAGALQLSGADNRLSTNAALAVSNSAVLDLNGLGQRVTGLSGAGTITNSPVTSGRLIVNVASGANTFSGTMQGGMNFEKTGAGTMVLAGNNGFTGAVNVLGGTLSVGADTNLGNAANAVTLSNNTAAVNFSSSFSSSRSFTVASGTTGTLLAGSGVTTTLNGNLSKNGSVLVFGGGGSFVVNGVISGASANSDLVVSNSTVTLTSTNTYSGPTYVHTGGTLNVGINNAMPTNTDLYLGTGSTSGTVNLQGYNQTVASLQIQGTAGTNNVITLGGGNLTVNGSSSTTYAGLISGSGSFVKAGTSTLALTATNTYSGSTTISNGTLQVSLIADGGAASSIGTGSTVTMSGTTTSTNANASTTAVMDYTGGNVTTDRAFVMDNGGGTINMATAATEMTLTGSASGTGKLIVGEGTLILNGGGNNAFAPGSIQVDSGATLQLAANNQIGDTTGLILNGGTFRVGTASTGFSDTLGTLTLSASSTIDLGAWSTGVRTLTFANSSAISWTGTLTITNWQGVALQSSDVSEILFGTGGLTSTQLGQIYFANQNINGGTLIGGGELVPIPEPRVYAAAVALLAAVGWRERKRLIGLLRRKR